MTRARVELISLDGIPRVMPGSDLPALVISALQGNRIEARAGDVLAITSKVFSRAQGRFVDLAGVAPSSEALTLAERVDKDARLVHVILSESIAVSRAEPGVLIVRHHAGHVCANAGVDSSNAQPPDAPPGTGPWVLLLPNAPDASVAALRAGLREHTGVELGLIMTDSLGRPFRHGTVGFALGCAGLPALSDERGRLDLDGRPLEHTYAATADQIAAAADLMAGQADEGRPITLLRGLSLTTHDPGDGATALNRAPKEDLYA